MTFEGRKKENIRNFLVILVGMVVLTGISVGLRILEIKEEVVDSEEIQVQEVENLQIALEIEPLYLQMSTAMNETLIREVVEDLVGGSFLEEVVIKNKAAGYGISLCYQIEQHDQGWSREEKEQLALVNSSILMSLFGEVDVVKVSIKRGESYYEKVIYKPNLESYFGIKLAGRIGKPTFERIANEFLDLDAVSTYFSQVDIYDSQMGEKVSGFFKWEFPAEWEEEVFPYLDENLGEELVEAYGYKLWIQGLNYEHPLVNYYSAYQLMAYYGNSNLDEILLELASCMRQTENISVRSACELAIKVLSMRKEAAFVFTKYGESNMKGGQKLYSIKNQQLSELALWQGDERGHFEVLSMNQNKERVLCKVATTEKVYFYVIPLDLSGQYRIDETGVWKDETLISKELTALINERMMAFNEDEMQKVVIHSLEGNWLFDNVLSIFVNDETEYIYDAEKNSLMSRIQFEQNFDTEYLLASLEEQFEEVAQKELRSSADTIGKKVELVIGKEKITIYEYESIVQKVIAQRSANEGAMSASYEIGQAEGTAAVSWNKGKLLVTYEGENEQFIQALNQILS